VIDPNILIVVSAGATALVTGGPAWFLLRSNKRKADIAAAGEVVRTDSVAMDTAGKFVSLLNAQVERYGIRIAALESENDSLRAMHQKCASDLADMRRDLAVGDAERKRLEALIGIVQTKVDRIDHDNKGETP